MQTQNPNLSLFFPLSSFCKQSSLSMAFMAPLGQRGPWSREQCGLSLEHGTTGGCGVQETVTPPAMLDYCSCMVGKGTGLPNLLLPGSPFPRGLGPSVVFSGCLCRFLCVGCISSGLCFLSLVFYSPALPCTPAHSQKHT